MKNFTLILLMFAFAFGFSYQAKALKEVKPTRVTEPSDFRIAAGFATNFTYWIKNTGDEAILATDSIYVTFGVKISATQIQFQQLKYTMKTGGLAVGDSFSQTFSLKIDGTQPGLITLAFAASMKSWQITYILVNFNLITGIEDQSKVINKVYYSENNLNITLDSKVSTIANLMLTNLNGQVLDSRKMNLTQGNVQETLYLGTLPKGIYILNMETSYGTDSKKFFVQ
jgi:hypothetical protein